MDLVLGAGAAAAAKEAAPSVAHDTGDGDDDCTCGSGGITASARLSSATAASQSRLLAVLGGSTGAYGGPAGGSPPDGGPADNGRATTLAGTFTRTLHRVVPQQQQQQLLAIELPGLASTTLVQPLQQQQIQQEQEQQQEQPLPPSPPPPMSFTSMQGQAAARLAARSSRQLLLLGLVDPALEAPPAPRHGSTTGEDRLLQRPRSTRFKALLGGGISHSGVWLKGVSFTASRLGRQAQQRRVGGGSQAGADTSSHRGSLQLDKDRGSNGTGSGRASGKDRSYGSRQSGPTASRIVSRTASLTGTSLLAAAAAAGGAAALARPKGSNNCSSPHAAAAGAPPRFTRSPSCDDVRWEAEAAAGAAFGHPKGAEGAGPAHHQPSGGHAVAPTGASMDGHGPPDRRGPVSAFRKAQSRLSMLNPIALRPVSDAAHEAAFAAAAADGEGEGRRGSLEQGHSGVPQDAAHGGGGLQGTASSPQEVRHWWARLGLPHEPHLTLGREAAHGAAAAGGAPAGQGPGLGPGPGPGSAGLMPRASAKARGMLEAVGAMRRPSLPALRFAADAAPSPEAANWLGPSDAAAPRSLPLGSSASAAGPLPSQLLGSPFTTSQHTSEAAAGPAPPAQARPGPGSAPVHAHRRASTTWLPMGERGSGASTGGPVPVAALGVCGHRSQDASPTAATHLPQQPAAGDDHGLSGPVGGGRASSLTGARLSGLFARGLGRLPSRRRATASVAAAQAGSGGTKRLTYGQVLMQAAAEDAASTVRLADGGSGPDAAAAAASASSSAAAAARPGHQAVGVGSSTAGLQALTRRPSSVRPQSGPWANGHGGAQMLHTAAAALPRDGAWKAPPADADSGAAFAAGPPPASCSAMAGQQAVRPQPLPGVAPLGQPDGSGVIGVCGAGGAAVRPWSLGLGGPSDPGLSPGASASDHHSASTCFTLAPGSSAGHHQQLAFLDSLPAAAPAALHQHQHAPTLSAQALPPPPAAAEAAAGWAASLRASRPVVPQPVQALPGAQATTHLPSAQQPLAFLSIAEADISGGGGAVGVLAARHSTPGASPAFWAGSSDSVPGADGPPQLHDRRGTARSAQLSRGVQWPRGADVMGSEGAAAGGPSQDDCQAPPLLPPAPGGPGAAAHQQPPQQQQQMLTPKMFRSVPPSIGHLPEARVKQVGGVCVRVGGSGCTGVREG